MKASYLGHTDIIGVFVGIVGIVLACVFYVRSKEQIRPYILIERTTLIGKSQRLFPESVEIHYNGRVVPTLSKARITFWNAGRRTLNESDVAHNDPITIKFSKSEAQVLDIRSVTATRDIINAKAFLEDNIIFLSFDFLDKDDGLALEAFYDGESESEITLSGTIKGVRDGVTVRTSKDTVRYRTRPDRSGAPGKGFRTAGLASLWVVVIIVGSILFSHWKVNYPDIVLSTIFSVFGISFLVYGTYSYFLGRIPRALRRDSGIVKSAEADKQPHGIRQP